MSAGDPAGGRRVCLLTGAGGTLGNAFCRLYADDYDIVAVSGRRAPAAPSQHDSFVDPLDPATPVEGVGRGVYVVHADLEEDGAVEHVVDLVLARHGRVDLLVNNAARTGFHVGGVVDGDAALDDAPHYFRLNVEVPLRLAVRVAQRSWTAYDADNRTHNRNVVNVSSTSGHRVHPGGQAVYGASKAALNHLTRYLAGEFAAFGVRVNGLAPTSFPARVATEEVAAGIVRLDRESVSGRILTVGSDD